MHGYDLRNDQCGRIKELLSGRKGLLGVMVVNNRLFVEAMPYSCRAGVPRPDLAESFSDWGKMHRRFNRWAKSSVWRRLFRYLAAGGRIATIPYRANC